MAAAGVRDGFWNATSGEYREPDTLAGKSIGGRERQCITALDREDADGRRNAVSAKENSWYLRLRTSAVGLPVAVQLSVGVFARLHLGHGGTRVGCTS